MSKISSCDACLTFRSIVITASDTFSILCVGSITDGSSPAEYFQITQSGNVFQSHCTLSGGSHCFQPAHLPCTDREAAQGDDRWCLLPSTEQSHTPSCLQTPCCHCLGLLGQNPGWWELCGLKRRRQKRKMSTLLHERALPIKCQDNQHLSALLFPPIVLQTSRYSCVVQMRLYCYCITIIMWVDSSLAQRSLKV